MDGEQYLCNRNFFWFKCDHNFFDNHKIRGLERLQVNLADIDQSELGTLVSMAMGYVYMKMLAESCTHDGSLMFDEETPYDSDRLAAALGCSPKFIDLTLARLKYLNLATVSEDGTISFPQFSGLIGRESGSARRMREKRARDASEASRTPQEAEKPIRTDKETKMPAKAGRPVSGAPVKPVEGVDYEVNEKKFAPVTSGIPTLEQVLEHIKAPNAIRGSRRMPDEFAIDWYQTMTHCGWKDSNGQDCTRCWKMKLGWAWSDEIKRNRDRDARLEEGAKRERDEADLEARRQKVLLAEDPED